MRATESRVEHWLQCPNKTCCSYYLVYVTGDDVARIARTLGVPPWTFTVALPCAMADVGAFALDNSPARHRLALVRTRESGDEPPFCTFLIRATDGAARCGLGAGRPAACRSFPAQLLADGVAFETSGCTCDWSNVSPDAADATLLRAEERTRKRYDDVIATWNDYAARLADGVELKHGDFCRYLMDAYAPEVPA